MAAVWLLVAPLLAENHPPADHAVALRAGWALQSSCKVNSTGQQISTVGFDTPGWHRTEVPTTVVAALVADKTFPDPYVGMSFRSLPGVSYPIGDLFSESAMPPESPFRCSWWFRTEFQDQADARLATRWLRFDGVNYRANVWLNGHKIADAKDVAGTFRAFEFNVSDVIRQGGNALAVEVFAPGVTDLAINWWDWNPTPPDKNMGLWNEVWLVSSGPAALRHPFATAKLSPALDSAALSLEVEIHNVMAQPLSGDLTAKVGNITVSRRVDLQASESKLVTFSAEDFPSLRIAHPRLWWPYTMGPQDLYTAEFKFATAGGGVSDSAHIRFGIREITSELTPQQARLFRINGRKLYVVGGGWASDMLRLRESPQRVRDEFAYIRHMRLNAIRLEGKLEDDDFYDLADEQGILLMPGFMCCDIWQKWDKWPPENLLIARESERTQLLRLRNHPSVLMWFYGSDEPPPPPVEKEYVQVIEETHWPNPILATASDRTTPMGGRSGMKMSGPYDYVPPSYWYEPAATNINYGGGFAFNTETSAGAAIPPRESLEKMLTPAHLWPIDDAWSLHSAGDEFRKFDRLVAEMSAIYGPAADLPDFLRKAHAMEFDSQRAMFEAYRRNKYSSTGIIQWMLNNAWPSLYWHLYDWYLVPSAGYFSARAGNEPLHIQYSYDDRSIAVVSSLPEPRNRLNAVAELYDFDLHRRFTRKVPVNLPADGVQRILSLPELTDSPVSFLRLRLEDGRGRTLSSNFYWLSARPSTFDWKKSTFYNTPSPQYEDFTALARLPEARLDWSARFQQTAAGPEVRVQLRNPGTTLAFQACLRAYRKPDGGDVVPVMWDDNYFSLLPGESKSVTTNFAPGQSFDDLVIELSGWNVAAESKPVVRSRGTH